MAIQDVRVLHNGKAGCTMPKLSSNSCISATESAHAATSHACGGCSRGRVPPTSSSSSSPPQAAAPWHGQGRVCMLSSPPLGAVASIGLYQVVATGLGPCTVQRCTHQPPPPAVPCSHLGTQARHGQRATGTRAMPCPHTPGCRTFWAALAMLSPAGRWRSRRRRPHSATTQSPAGCGAATARPRRPRLHAGQCMGGQGRCIRVCMYGGVHVWRWGRAGACACADTGGLGQKHRGCGGAHSGTESCTRSFER